MMKTTDEENADERLMDELLIDRLAKIDSLDLSAEAKFAARLFAMVERYRTSVTFDQFLDYLVGSASSLGFSRK